MEDKNECLQAMMVAAESYSFSTLSENVSFC